MIDWGRCDIEPSSSCRLSSSYRVMYFEYSVDRSLMNTGSRCWTHQTGNWSWSVVVLEYGA